MAPHFVASLRRLTSSPDFVASRQVSANSLLDIAVLQITGTITTAPPVFSGIRTHGPGFVVEEARLAVTGLPYLAFSTSSTSANTGDEAMLYGYPVGPNFNTKDMRLTIAKTIINSKTDPNNAYVLVDATNVAATACSGGPLLNGRGVIVGLMSKVGVIVGLMSKVGVIVGLMSKVGVIVGLMSKVGVIVGLMSKVGVIVE
jgi:hypothetical protein